MMGELSSKTMVVRRKCHHITKIPEELSIQIQSPVKISCKNEVEVKIFSNEGKLRECVASRSLLKEVLKTVLQMRGQ